MSVGDALKMQRGQKAQSWPGPLSAEPGLEQPALDPIMILTSLLGPSLMRGGMEMAQAAPRIIGNEAGALLPEDLARINAKPFFHGSSTPGLTKEVIDPLVTNHENLFGQGLYMSDNPQLAESYAGKRGVQKALYQARLNMSKGINLEDAVEPDMQEAIVGQAEKIDRRLGYEVRPDHTLGDDTESFSQNLKDKIRNGEIKTNQELFRHFREGIKDISVNEQIPTSEWVEDFQELTDAFKTKGYQGFTHTGGLRAGKGKLLHEVAVLLDPKAISEFSQVK